MFMLKKTLLGLALAALAGGASAEVLDFEGVQATQFLANQISGYSLANTNSYLGPISTDYPGYGGLQWSYTSGNNDFRIIKADDYLSHNATAPAGNGIVNGLVSGSWVAINGGGDDVWFQSLAGGPKFNFDSAYMSAAWYNGLKVDIAGYRDGVQVYSLTTDPLSFTAQLLTLNWTNLDKVSFHSWQDSGTVIDNQSTYNHAFVIDDLSVTPVPEPGTYALMLAGLGLVAGIARRRKQV